jgi:hypothetical protein
LWRSCIPLLPRLILSPSLTGTEGSQHCFFGLQNSSKEPRPFRDTMHEIFYTSAPGVQTFGGTACQRAMRQRPLPRRPRSRQPSRHQQPHQGSLVDHRGRYSNERDFKHPKLSAGRKSDQAREAWQSARRHVTR